MKTTCLPGYHRNGLVATHAHGHMMCYYAHLASVRFEHSVCRGLLVTIYIYIYIYIIYIYKLLQLDHENVKLRVAIK